MLGCRDDVGFGAFATTIPRSVAALDVDVVDADAGASDHPQARRPRDQLGRHLGGRADHDPVVGADALGELLVAPVHPDLDVEVLAQERDPRVADLLLDEHLRTAVGALLVAAELLGRRAHAALLSSTQSMHAVSAWTSDVSIAGNIPTRNWLRPSLR